MSFPQDQELSARVSGFVGGHESLIDVSLPAAIGRTDVAVDFLVLGERGIVAVNKMDSCGTVSGQRDDRYWEIVGTNGKKRTIDNPYAAAKHVLAAMGQLSSQLASRCVSVWVFPEGTVFSEGLIDMDSSSCIICSADELETGLSRWTSRNPGAVLSRGDLRTAHDAFYPRCHEGRMAAISGKVKMTPKQARNTRRIKRARKGHRWPIVAVVVVCLVVAVGVFSRGGDTKTGVSASNAANTAISSADSAQSGGSSRLGVSSEAATTNLGTSEVQIDGNTASGTTGAKKGNTYVDGKGFAAMINLDKQSVNLHNQVMDAWKAGGESLTADQVATYSSQISDLKTQYSTCKYHSSYQEFMQLSYDAFCLLEAFVADVGKGYEPAALNSILTQMNTTNESKRAALEYALDANGISYTVTTDGTVNFHYYDY